MYISNAQSTEEDLPSMAEKEYLDRNSDPSRNESRQRSHSSSTYEQSRAKDLIERMKHIFKYKINESKGFSSYKGNIRSEYIQASFVTLEDFFMKLPEPVGFDIEISESLHLSENMRDIRVSATMRLIMPASCRVPYAIRSPRLGNGNLCSRSESSR